MSRCQNGTRRNKKTGNCEPHSKGTHTLSTSEINQLIKDTHVESKEKKEIRKKLKTLKHQKRYKDCFTGKLVKELYGQAYSKILCHFKYRDPIE